MVLNLVWHLVEAQIGFQAILALHDTTSFLPPLCAEAVARRVAGGQRAVTRGGAAPTRALTRRLRGATDPPTPSCDARSASSAGSSAGPGAGARQGVKETTHAEDNPGPNRRLAAG